MRAAALALLMMGACSHRSNPCAGQGDFCVTVEVHGTPSPLDELDVSATQLPGRSIAGRAALPSGGFGLPVQFAALLPPDFVGPILLEVVGGKDGVPLSYGSVALTLPPSGQRMKVQMAPLHTGDGGAPFDLSRFGVGNDLASTATDLAVKRGNDLAGPPRDMAITPPCTANCNVGSFTVQSQHLIPPRTAFGILVIGRNVYLVGGQDGTALASTNTVQRAPINPDGSLGTFADAGTHLVVPRQLVAAAATDSFVYVAGGAQADSSGLTNTVLSSVESAPINADGSLGAFSTLTSALTTARDSHSMAVVGSNLVVLGGENSSSTTINGVEVAPILSSGGLGSFTAGPSLVHPQSPVLVNTGTFLYSIGGGNGGDTFIERAPITGGSLGTFSQQSIMLTTRRVSSTATLVGNDVYVVGGGFADIDAGVGGVTFPTFVERAHVDGTGALGNFSVASGVTLQIGRGGHGTAFTGNSLYVIGGFDGTNDLDSIERAIVQ
jgi:Kelch motif